MLPDPTPHHFDWSDHNQKLASGEVRRGPRIHIICTSTFCEGSVAQVEGHGPEEAAEGWFQGRQSEVRWGQKRGDSDGVGADRVDFLPCSVLGEVA